MIKNKKQFPYSTVMLLLSVIVPLIPKHSWEHLYFVLDPKLSLLRSPKDCLKSLHSKSLQPSVIQSLLTHFPPSLQHTVWSLSAAGGSQGTCTAFPTKVPSTCWSHLYRLLLSTAPSSFCRAPLGGQFSCFFHTHSLSQPFCIVFRSNIVSGNTTVLHRFIPFTLQAEIFLLL